MEQELKPKLNIETGLWEWNNTQYLEVKKLEDSKETARIEKVRNEMSPKTRNNMKNFEKFISEQKGKLNRDAKT